MRDYPRVYFACHRRHVRDSVSGRVLSAHQASVLDHLDAVEPTSVSGLAGHMGVTASTMSLTLDRLEAGGFVERRPDEEDQRRVCVRLTVAGERIRQSSSVLDPALVTQLLAVLSDDERNRAVGGLALLAEAAERMGARGWTQRAESRTKARKERADS